MQKQVFQPFAWTRRAVRFLVSKDEERAAVLVQMQVQVFQLLAWTPWAKARLLQSRDSGLSAEGGSHLPGREVTPLFLPFEWGMGKKDVAAALWAKAVSLTAY